MLLLDYVAQCTQPFVVEHSSGGTWRLVGASDSAKEVRHCPLRYVVADDLLRACIELAYSEGAGLSACLDLVHFPAEQLWVEWSSAVQREELARMLPECARAGSSDSVRQGVLISADATGRTGRFRSFWLTPTDPAEPVMAAVETLVDLSGCSQLSPAEGLLEGGPVGIRDPQNVQIDNLLQCTSFRLEASWQGYYAAEAGPAADRNDITKSLLGTVAFSGPLLIALFLLVGLRSELEHTEVSRERINAKRLRLGRRPLLSHIEVSCPVLAAERRVESKAEFGASRTGPRLHHVRGHIVRREDVIFWRRSHWRGHLRLGSVRTRTVTLRLPRAAAPSRAT